MSSSLRDPFCTVRRARPYQGLTASRTCDLGSVQGTIHNACDAIVFSSHIINFDICFQSG
jgi:hypothetical protein